MFKEDEELLGKIAADFRAACNHRLSEVELDVFAKRYAEAVNRLIASGQWKDCPPPEDQLPMDMMPAAFFEYWYMERKPDKISHEPPTVTEQVIGVVMFVLIGVGVFFLMSACGGCWNSGSRLFLK